jgi:hypothetical protein
MEHNIITKFNNTGGSPIISEELPRRYKTKIKHSYSIIKHKHNQLSLRLSPLYSRHNKKQRGFEYPNKHTRLRKRENSTIFTHLLSHLKEETRHLLRRRFSNKSQELQNKPKSIYKQTTIRY